MDYKKIGEFIQQRRKELGLTQKQLGEKLGVTDKAVSKWETGLGCPDISIIEPLADLLSVNVIELLKGEDYDDQIFGKNDIQRLLKDIFNLSNISTKERIKRILSSIIVTISFLIMAIILFFNIFNIIYLNKEAIVSVNALSSIDSYKNSLNEVKVKVDLLNTGKSNIISESDYIELLEIVNGYYDSLKDSKILDLNLNDKVNISDFTLMLNYDFISIYKCLDILKNYDSKIGSFLQFYATQKSSNIMSLSYDLSVIYNYDYVISDNLKINRIDYLFDNYNTSLNEMNYILDIIIEVGEINE